MLENTRVLVTGRFWTGADGARTIGPVLIDLIENARQEILIVAYRLTIAHDELRKSLEAALARGCHVKIILDANADPNVSEANFFNYLLKQYPNLCIWDFRESNNNQNMALHAKMIVADRKSAVVGSANFSRNGLIENHELALWVHGKTARSLCVASEVFIKEATKAGMLKKRLDA